MLSSTLAPSLQRTESIHTFQYREPNTGPHTITVQHRPFNQSIVVSMERSNPIPPHRNVLAGRTVSVTHATAENGIPLTLAQLRTMSNDHIDFTRNPCLLSVMSTLVRIRKSSPAVAEVLSQYPEIESAALAGDIDLLEELAHDQHANAALLQVFRAVIEAERPSANVRSFLSTLVRPAENR
jgi:hypothetical protein